VQADPKFVSAAAGNFQLLGSSPAIDAANSAAPNWPTTDATGHARVNHPGVADAGAGPVKYSDRGALEFVTDQAPVVTAPATATVAENGLLTVNVTAADPDGNPITSLTAAGLPAGATFTPGAGNTSGTLSWTPDFSKAGSYSVTFTASNALTSSRTTAITVTNTDRAPVVTAPATATVAEGEKLTVTFTAVDPDGDAISSLGAVGVPPGAGLITGVGNHTGTLTWTPGFSRAGTYSVTFTAKNALTGADTTVITVTDTDRAPVVTAPATASVAENGHLAVNVTASDPDGAAIDSLTVTGLPAGAVFTAGPGNTSGGLTWVPGAGDTGTHVVIFTAYNTRASSDTTVITVTGATADVGGMAGGRVPRVVPNPIRQSGHLRFTLAREGAVRVDIFDLTGRLVGTPLDESHAQAGPYEVALGSSSRDARPLPSGLYFFRIQSPDGTSRGRFMVRR
jgi:hypothetical protein